VRPKQMGVGYKPVGLYMPSLPINFLPAHTTAHSEVQPSHAITRSLMRRLPSSPLSGALRAQPNWDGGQILDCAWH
jgi:hypothetical protein